MVGILANAYHELGGIKFEYRNSQCVEHCVEHPMGVHLLNHRQAFLKRRKL